MVFEVTELYNACMGSSKERAETGYGCENMILRRAGCFGQTGERQIPRGETLQQVLAHCAACDDLNVCFHN